MYVISRATGAACKTEIHRLKVLHASLTYGVSSLTQIREHKYGVLNSKAEVVHWSVEDKVMLNIRSCLFHLWSMFLDCVSRLCESGSDDEAAEAEEERGEALSLQTLHQHAHLRRHRYGKYSVCLYNVCWITTLKLVCVFQRRSSSSSGPTRPSRCLNVSLWVLRAANSSCWLIHLFFHFIWKMDIYWLNWEMMSCNIWTL